MLLRQPLLALVRRLACVPCASSISHLLMFWRYCLTMPFGWVESSLTAKPSPCDTHSILNGKYTSIDSLPETLWETLTICYPSLLAWRCRRLIIRGVPWTTEASITTWCP